MLSSVLNSKRAIQVNIKLLEHLLNLEYKRIKKIKKIENMEKNMMVN